MDGGLKGCMVPRYLPCAGTQTSANLGRALTRVFAPQRAPHLNSAYHSEHRSVGRRYRGRQAQGNRLAILVETLPPRL